MYQIQSKSDFQAGTTLIVKIPEEDVDKKALYTITADWPDFILPFRHRAVDGQIEFSYQIGNRSKLTYLSGNRSPDDYINLWFSILQPLLECGDWFMNPYSFMLNLEYLYCDKNSKSICFLYIPSARACSDYSLLKDMATEIAKQNHVSDVNLENKVVWAIQDFNPNNFMQMLKHYKSNTVQKTTSKNTSEPNVSPQPPQAEQYAPRQPAPEPKPIIAQKPQTPPRQVVSQDNPDDIAINFPTVGKTAKTAKPKKTKEPKPASKEKGGFWGKKKQQQEIILGAAVTPHPEAVREQPATPVYTPPIDIDDDVTRLDIRESNVPIFRYAGSGEHPKVIEVDIAERGIFTIGRFDASVGTKQSSFEFDNKTKAVSRRHAAVERKSDGYVLVDLDSAAGTFINGQKMPPNTPIKLEFGSRVSFGSSGADYVFEI